MIRNEPLKNERIYHVYNRTLNDLTVFPTQRDYDHTLLSLWFFQKTHSQSLSKYLRMPTGIQQDFILGDDKILPKIDIICFSLMPNHFHLILKQNRDNGISKFMGDFQNCLTRYFNKKHNHQGPIFHPQFKANYLDSNNAIIHACRYVLINPIMAFIIHRDQLSRYPNTSFPECIGNMIIAHTITKPKILMSNFKNIEKFVMYINDEIDYKRQLNEYKSLFDNI